MFVFKKYYVIVFVYVFDQVYLTPSLLSSNVTRFFMANMIYITPYAISVKTSAICSVEYAPINNIQKFVCLVQT